MHIRDSFYMTELMEGLQPLAAVVTPLISLPVTTVLLADSGLTKPSRSHNRRLQE